jgi:hypothetical protein
VGRREHLLLKKLFFLFITFGGIGENEMKFNEILTTIHIMSLYVLQISCNTHSILFRSFPFIYNLLITFFFLDKLPSWVGFGLYIYIYIYGLNS